MYEIVDMSDDVMEWDSKATVMKRGYAIYSSSEDDSSPKSMVANMATQDYTTDSEEEWHVELPFPDYSPEAAGPPQTYAPEAAGQAPPHQLSHDVSMASVSSGTPVVQGPTNVYIQNMNVNDQAHHQRLQAGFDDLYRQAANPEQMRAVSQFQQEMMNLNEQNERQQRDQFQQVVNLIGFENAAPLAIVKCSNLGCGRPCHMTSHGQAYTTCCSKCVPGNPESHTGSCEGRYNTHKQKIEKIEEDFNNALDHGIMTWRQTEGPPNLDEAD